MTCRIFLLGSPGVPLHKWVVKGGSLFLLLCDTIYNFIVFHFICTVHLVTTFQAVKSTQQ